jgi:hypothetical protein
VFDHAIRCPSAGGCSSRLNEPLVRLHPRV